MSRKLRVGVLFGGKSGEHNVSLLSAASVMDAIDLNRYEVVPIGIEKSGLWKWGKSALTMIAGNMKPEKGIAIANQLPVARNEQEQTLAVVVNEQLDVIFPVLHGTYGEDGTIQGFFEMANLPYVGAGVLASAVGMDKVFTKKLFAEADLPQANYVYYRRTDLEKNQATVIEEIETELGYPCFVKPANLGSSVGISKATNREELYEALKLAAQYDLKIVIEEFVSAREIEVAVLGNHQPEASMPGEIISSNEFYDYKAKYVDGKSKLQIPAHLPQETIERIRSYAIQAFQAIDGSGLSRVDFFVRKDDGQILINEINTMPGFTAFSMYAKLWEHAGISYSALISRLIDLAVERHQEKASLVTTFEVE